MGKLKNLILRVLFWLLAPWRKVHPPSSRLRILVVSTTGLGDTIWAIPGLASLRSSFPSCYLAVLSSNVGAEALANNPHIDALYKFTRSMWRKLYRERFSHVLIFHASQRSANFLSAILGASKVIGTAGQMKGLEWVLTDAIPPQFEHEAERRSRIIEHIGAAPISAAPKVYLLDAERQAHRLPEGRWAALHPGAKEPFRRWPLEHFIKVGRVLQQKGMQILITGSADERSIMEAIAQGLPGALLLDPKSSVRKLAALLEQMELVVSNDTGPLHLAAALDRPVIGLYGPTDPRLCGPYRAEKITIISCKPTCTPCLRKKCSSPFCLLQIGPEETIRAL